MSGFVKVTIDAIRYVYLDNRKDAGVFTVGFYDPQGKWHPESDWSTSDEAAARVHFLNGGE